MILGAEDLYQNVVVTGVEPGTVVVTNKTVNEFLKEEHEIVS